MAQYSVVWTAYFTRSARKFLRKHPELRGTFAETLQLLATNPFAPSLRPHALSGRLAGKQAVSINYSYRIVLFVEVKDREVILYDVGSHDDVYG